MQMAKHEPRFRNVEIARHVLQDLTSACSGNVQTDVDLAGISRWKIGGRAPLLVKPRTVKELKDSLAILNENRQRFVVFGSTTNLLFSDEGLYVVAIQISNNMSDVSIEGPNVIAGAGVWVPGLARRIAVAGLTGAEHISGIPGTLGGLVCMNGGSQRLGIGSSIDCVVTVTPTGVEKRYSHSECKFSYRSSLFQTNSDMIVEVHLKFGTDNSSAIRSRMLRILRERRRKFPQKTPNCGSVFVSDPAMYADFGPPGAVIEACGLKGLRIGGATISSLHANFIVNTGNACAKDVLSLIKIARSTVANKLGYAMACEVRFVEPGGNIVPAHVKADELTDEQSI